jgi:ADP-ribose pyrophosphatase YjhB (NUDIX family)
MDYCPVCGRVLEPAEIENHKVKKCVCGYIDWDNWVNLSAVSVCYNEHHEFMMVHLKGKSQGIITFPGGFRNLGETLEEAAKRECFEESGYLIDDLKLYKIYTKDDLRLVWVVYKAKIIGGSFLENSETEKVSFFSTAHPPQKNLLRGSLTEGLLQDLISEDDHEKR